MSKENPNYFAVIPATVLYSKTLSAPAKLLYAEISALTNEKGFCWASNEYFAKNHDVAARSIQNWLSELKNGGFIEINYEYSTNTKEIKTRKIKLAEAGHLAKPEQSPAAPFPKPPAEPQAAAVPPAPDAPAPDATPAAVSEAPTAVTAAPSGELPPDAEEGVKNSSPPHEEIFTTPMKNSSPPHEKIFMENNINSNNKFNTPPTPPPEPPPAPPQAGEPAAAGEAELSFQKKSQEIKNTFANLDRCLIFDHSFYPRAVKYMAKHNLDSAFLSWLFAYSQKYADKSIAGFYYKVFFDDRIRELFLSSRPARQAASPITCPVCGAQASADAQSCRVCDFAFSGRGNDEIIREARAIWLLPPDQKAAYNHELNELTSNTHPDLFSRFNAILALRKRFGIAGT